MKQDPLFTSSYYATGKNGEQRLINFDFYPSIGWCISSEDSHWSRKNGHRIVFPENPAEHEKEVNEFYRKLEELKQMDIENEYQRTN